VVQPFSGVRVFDRNYDNPRVYTANASFEQELYPNWSLYIDYTHSKGVHLTTFLDVNGRGFVTDEGVTVLPGTFSPALDFAFVTSSRAKSLYDGVTVGMRKRFSQRYQLEWNYVVSRDLDSDSNERDPFTDRRLDPFDPSRDYNYADRDIRHKFNFVGYVDAPGDVQLNARFQARSAQPITDTTCGTCKRNTLRKDNEYYSFDWRIQRPFRFGDNERYAIVPLFEMFNTFNSKNNINPLVTPALFNFDGFLRQGVGDPRQAQFAVKLTF
jgi:hypothetical protein